MIAELLGRNEGKTLEFKENTKSLPGIIKTVIAFANTAGGILVVGIKNGVREVVGVENPLQEEERIANAIAASIEPLTLPNIEIQTYRNKQILIIRISHGAGPYFLKSAGPEEGVYVRLGSTNRVADKETLHTLRLLPRNKTFDELPEITANKDSLDWNLITTLFANVDKKITKEKAETLGLLVRHMGELFPSIGAIILFGKNRLNHYPDAIIRCARFLGTTRDKVLDQKNFDGTLFEAIDQALTFIERHTNVRAEIGRIKRTDIPDYPSLALREAIINAVVHADYAITGRTITIAVYDDRIEFANPGGLVLGLTLTQALSGSSKVRNRVIAKVFNALHYIEQWGTGLQKIISSLQQRGLTDPKIEDHGSYFLVTMYCTKAQPKIEHLWQKKLLEYLHKNKEIATGQAAKLWGVSERTARTRLKTMAESGLVKKIGTAKKDPYARYILVPQYY